MFKKFRNTKFKKFVSTVALVCFLLVVLVFVCWINLISYITAVNLVNSKFIYLYMYYEILIYWVLLAHFSFMLPLIRQCSFLFLLFFLFFSLFFLWSEIVLSTRFWKVTKAVIKRHFAKYLYFQFDKLYKVMQSFSNIRQYPGNLSTLSQRCC